MTKPILSNPRHGWATLTLPTTKVTEPPFTASISYVTDVMFDALTACMNYINDGIAAVKLISLRFPNVCIEKSVQTPRDIQSIANNLRKAYLTQLQS